jgi:phage terminase small subunit
MEIRMQEITKKQDMFCREYLVDLNGAQAAIRAGYSKNGANSKASQLLAIVSIQIHIASLMGKRAEQLNINAEYVLHRLVEIDQLDVIDIIDSRGMIRPTREWPATWRKAITSFEVIERSSVTEQGKVVEVLIKKIRWPDKLKNLELLGRHIEIRAFSEKANNPGIGIESILDSLSLPVDR